MGSPPMAREMTMRARVSQVEEDVLGVAGDGCGGNMRERVTLTQTHSSPPTPSPRRRGWPHRNTIHESRPDACMRELVRVRRRRRWRAGSPCSEVHSSILLCVSLTMPSWEAQRPSNEPLVHRSTGVPPRPRPLFGTQRAGALLTTARRAESGRASEGQCGRPHGLCDSERPNSV